MPNNQLGRERGAAGKGWESFLSSGRGDRRALRELGPAQPSPWGSSGKSGHAVPSAGVAEGQGGEGLARPLRIQPCPPAPSLCTEQPGPLGLSGRWWEGEAQEEQSRPELPPGTGGAWGAAGGVVSRSVTRTLTESRGCVATLCAVETGLFRDSAPSL